MLDYREISLKDQRKCLLKNAERADAAAFLHYFTQAHAETDFLTTYADEGTHSVEDMEERLAEKRRVKLIQYEKRQRDQRKNDANMRKKFF